MSFELPREGKAKSDLVVCNNAIQLNHSDERKYLEVLEDVVIGRAKEELRAHSVSLVLRLQEYSSIATRERGG